MFVVAVANSKGGSGKTTIATHLAARFAAAGHKTALADFDRQRSAHSWLERRPKKAPKIIAVEFDKGEGEIPGKIDRLVVDAVAAMRGKQVKSVVQRADLIIVPVLPSIFDEDGTRNFIAQLVKLKPIRKHKLAVALVGNRVRLRTRAADRLDDFLRGIDFPVVTKFRDTQLYANAADEGLSLFEIPGARARSYLDEWSPLLNFIEKCAR